MKTLTNCIAIFFMWVACASTIENAVHGTTWITIGEFIFFILSAIFKIISHSISPHMALRLVQLEKYQETQATRKYKKKMRSRKIRRSNKLEVPNFKYKGW